MRTLRQLAPALMTFAIVGACQLGLVAVAGTDIPFYDQWDVEGGWLYPKWRDGTFAVSDLLRAHNEHRIAWTHLWNLLLFAANRQWDPLVQQVANCALRAGAAAMLVGALTRGASRSAKWGWAAGITFAFLPHLAWHNALWGFQSQVYFALGLSWFALARLNAPSGLRTLPTGLIAGVAALLAMGPASLLTLPLLMMGAWQLWREGPRASAAWRQIAAGGLLFLLALLLRASAPEHDALRPATTGAFLTALSRLLAWPHVEMPLAAFAMNAPLIVFALVVFRRARRLEWSESFVVLLAGWAVSIAGATAWARGGAAELSTGAPSRYVDFLVLLPIANAACAVWLSRELAAWRPARWVASAWGVFLLIGWGGLTAQVMRGIVLPRAADREAPVRLMRQFEATRDPAVFAGQPRLLVPHPTPPSILRVLDDPALKGALPPSLQPEKPMGPLSRGVRAVLGR